MEIADVSEIKKEVIEALKPVPAEVTALQARAEENVRQIMAVDLDSVEKRNEVLQSIESFGMATMRDSGTKNSLMQVTVGKLSQGGAENGTVATGLEKLHLQLKDLDPSALDFAKTGLLGKIFNPMRSYFEKYEKADSVISAIVESLERGKATLKNDNITLQIEQQSLRELTKKLGKEIELGVRMDAVVVAQVEEAKARNEIAERIQFVTEEVLFPLRQRVMDMQQMIVVNQQGVLAIEIVTKNNKELMRGVDRAQNVTVTALKIAVTVASALYNQKIVLKKIQLLNDTTNNIISATSKMLKEQGVEIQKQAMESNISADVMKTAFEDALSALDSISNYKQEALPKMLDTISKFRELADKGEAQILRLEKGHKIGL